MRKCDNKTFELFEDGTLHLYDNITEVQMDETIEYECDLYVTKTKLSETEVKASFETLLAECKQAKAKMQAELDAEQAEQNLLSTDWVENQLSRCEKLYGSESDEYKALFERRKDLLMQREAWVEIIRNAD